MAAPFYWEKRQAWYVNVRKPNGKRGRIKLAKTKKRAMEIWKAMEANTTATDPLLATVANSWIEHLTRQATLGAISSGHVTHIEKTISQMLNESPRMRWSGFTREHVYRFGEAKGWSKATARVRFGLFRQLSRYANKEMGLNDNIEGIKRPRAEPREKVLTNAEYRMLLETAMAMHESKRAFALMLAGLWHTGARPSELCNAKIGQLKDSRIVLTEWKNSSKTGKKRVIYLDVRAMLVVGLAIGDRTDPNDHIFIDGDGEPYTAEKMQRRMYYIRNKAGLDKSIICYSIRHTFAHRAIKSGVDFGRLAEIMGTSAQMIEQVYGHLADAHDVLAAANASIR